MKPLQSSINFDIGSNGPVSTLFLQKGIIDFLTAAAFIKQLPYGRNTDKNDLACVLTEARGTCSTKHALLKRLAAENGHDEVKLKLGLFKMNGINTPRAKKTLDSAGLSYLPEAHNYLSIHGQILDCTTAHSKEEDFINDLLEEIEIDCDQVVAFKQQYHQQYLETWLQQNNKQFSLAVLWQIREQCIRDLSAPAAHRH